MDSFLSAALEWLGASGAGLVSFVTDTTRALVREVVTAGVEAGQNPRQIARQLRAEWPEVARYRAERIARTESLRAANVGASAGHRAAADDFGLVLEKIWMATGDGRTRTSHAAVDGQRRPLGEPFDVGGHAAMEPLDPALPASESVQCRCTTRVEVVGRKSAPRPWREERDRRMRARYDAVKGDFASAPAAMQAVKEWAEAELGAFVSLRTVERAVWGR